MAVWEREMSMTVQLGEADEMVHWHVHVFPSHMVVIVYVHAA